MRRANVLHDDLVVGGEGLRDGGAQVAGYLVDVVLAPQKPATLSGSGLLRLQRGGSGEGDVPARRAGWEERIRLAASRLALGHGLERPDLDQPRALVSSLRRAGFLVHQRLPWIWSKMAPA